MILVRDIKLNINHTDDELNLKLIQYLRLEAIFGKNNVPRFEVKIVRQSVDARKKPLIFYIYTVALDFGENNSKVYKYLKKKNIKNADVYKPVIYKVPECGNEKLVKRPIVVGAGPAGLFCAYNLALRGFKPIILERGECVLDRQKTVESSFKSGKIDANSNVQFGEGGAGTFSDGKLNTLTKDVNGRNSFVLSIFAKFGAPDKITYAAKPHIGTDLLVSIVENIRNEIVSLGGEYRFNCLFKDFKCQNGSITGISYIDLKSNDVYELETDVLILCTGHSSRDTFELLYSGGIKMEQKSFAVGYRVSHPQSFVDYWQYGTTSAEIGLSSADYKVANETEKGKRVYSFCMCPGGYVVNASSEENQMCVNGMSESGRDSGYANSAIICAINPEDFIQNVVEEDHPLSGMYYQRNIEKKAYIKGNGSIVTQYFKDFEANIPSECVKDDDICTKGLTVNGNLRGIFNEDIDEAIIESIHKFGSTRKGFDGDRTVMYGIEARTSSPVRIPRDDSFMCNIHGIYPCGEGAGYAGGITSAAADGLKVSEAVISKYVPSY